MDTLILLLAGFLGVTAHCLLKAESLKRDARTANMPFKFYDYLSNDYLGICLSFISVLIWVIIFPEVSIKYPVLENYIRGSFVLMGLSGSYLVQLISSRSKQEIRNVVNTKTDIADNK